MDNSISSAAKTIGLVLGIVFAGYAAWLIFLFFCLGDPSRPPITVTPIPGSKIEVLLHGPGEQGNYSCIVMCRGTWTPRDLGPLQPNQIAPARLEDLGAGIFRVRWGDAVSGPYVIIDTKNELIIEDSNTANPKNQPFK